MSRHEPIGRRPHAAIVGAGLGGLASAMRLSAAGWRVTVVDRLDMPGGRGSALQAGGHRFDLGPTIVTAPSVFERLFVACGLDLHAHVDLRPLDPFYTIRWPDGSHLAARARHEDAEAEVRRLAPADLEGWRRFLLDSEARYAVGYEGLLTRPMHRFAETLRVLPQFARLRADRSILGLARARVRDERLRMALSFHPLFIGGDPQRVTSMYALVSHLESREGVHYCMGGVGALARAMQAAAEGLGARFRFGEQVEEVTLDRGRASGLRLASGERVAADIVVSNGDPGHTYGRLLPGRRRWTTKRLNRARWSMGLFVWHFGTRGTRALWPDAGHHTILAGPRYEGLLRDVFRRGVLADDMSVYVHRPSVTDPTSAPEGDDTFYALSPVPHLGHADPVDWAATAESYRRRVQRVLEERLLSGLGARLTESHVMTPPDFRDRYLSLHGSGFSLEPRILQSAWFRPHNVSEEVPGLYLVGAGTHPGAGLPGVVASAEVLMQVVPPLAPHLARRAPSFAEAAE